MDRGFQKIKLFAVTAPSKGGPLHKGCKPKAEVQFFGKLDYVVQKSKPKYSTTTVQCPPPLGANTLRRGNREGFKIWSPWGTRIEPLPVLRFLIHFSSRTERPFQNRKTLPRSKNHVLFWAPNSGRVFIPTRRLQTGMSGVSIFGHSWGPCSGYQGGTTSGASKV